MQSTELMSGKTFWDKPEGSTGKVVVGLIVLALGYLLFIGLPAIILLLQNVLYAGILAVIIFLAVVLLSNKQFRASMGALFQLAMRQLTGFVVEIDPIGVIKNYLVKLEEKMELMSNKLSELRGQIKQLENKQGENVRKIEQHLKLAQAAKSRNADDVVVLNTRQAGRLTESNKQYEESLMKMRQLDQVINKMHKAAKFVLEDMTNDVEVKERQYNTIKAAHAAFKSAMSVLSGDKDERAMYEQALEFVAEDLGNKVGEIERFLEDSSAFMNGIDVENDVFSKQGDDLLAKWLQDGDSAIAVKQPAVITYTPNEPLLLSGAKSTSKYINLSTTKE